MPDLYLKHGFDVIYTDFTHFIFENYFKMSDSESDSDEWSDAEYFDDLGAFDLENLDEMKEIISNRLLRIIIPQMMKIMGNLAPT